MNRFTVMYISGRYTVWDKNKDSPVVNNTYMRYDTAMLACEKIELNYMVRKIQIVILSIVIVSISCLKVLLS
jgi:hypothetical protein